jgi:chromosome segregation ATPase
MGNTPSHNIVEDTNDNTLLEVVDVDENEKLKNEYNTLKENFEMLNNELYSSKLEVKNLNKEIDNSKNENVKLVEELKSVNYLNEVLEIKTKSQINENNKLKERYDSLEYVKLDIEEKYLDLLDNSDSIDYLKKENSELEEDLKKQIIKYNDEKNINRILGDSLDNMTKQYARYKQLYSQNCIESNTLRSSIQQYKKEYDIIIKKNEKLLDSVSNSLNTTLFKKQLYECIGNICEIEPFVYNDIIEKIIKIVVNKIILEKNKID